MLNFDFLQKGLPHLASLVQTILVALFEKRQPLCVTLTGQMLHSSYIVSLFAYLQVILLSLPQRQQARGNPRS